MIGVGYGVSLKSFGTIHFTFAFVIDGAIPCFLIPKDDTNVRLCYFRFV